MTLRGLDLIAATTLVAELGDLRRFAHPRELMGYLGLVPSEHTTGSKRRLGAITKTGNSHVRRVLVEAAWNYRYPARISRELQVRQERQPPEIRAIAWRAQLRLNHRYRRLKARGLQPLCRTTHVKFNRAIIRITEMPKPSPVSQRDFLAGWGEIPAESLKPWPFPLSPGGVVLRGRTDLGRPRLPACGMNCMNASRAFRVRVLAPCAQICVWGTAGAG
jgi:hypothetical protein